MTRFPRTYTHPQRNMETELGNLMAECMREQLNVDLALMSSGTIRKPKLGPIITLMDFMEVFPFVDPAVSFKLTGKQLRDIVTYMLREDSFLDGEHNEWFQFSKGFFCEFNRNTHSIISLKMNGKEVSDDDIFTVVMHKYHFLSIEKFLNLPLEEIDKNGKPVEVATNSRNVLEEYFRSHENIKLDDEARLIIRQ